MVLPNRSLKERKERTTGEGAGSGVLPGRRQDWKICFKRTMSKATKRSTKLSKPWPERLFCVSLVCQNFYSFPLHNSFFKKTMLSMSWDTTLLVFFGSLALGQVYCVSENERLIERMRVCQFNWLLKENLPAPSQGLKTEPRQYF